ncbi:hypothetical protein QTO34_011194 [Cnephaeus nilssonii]|uniref:Uncharacterized protein n=1 Tax=Cnephaeus nilssonii TaxID=3371016 RepID=A0AA40LEW0_CNENI|nr:hypothetical protein QTO34_011194 [Eptesicus nilssonii]
MQRLPLEDTTTHPMGSQDRAQEEDNNPSMSSHLTATDIRALDWTISLLGPAQPDIGDAVAVRPATAKDSLAIQVDNLALPMRGLDTVRDSTMGLPMPSHETVLDTLVPNAGRQPSMDTPRTPRDTQTLMPAQDRDLDGDGLRTPLDNQAHIMQRLPLEDTTAHPMGSQDRAQEEDNNPSMSNQLTATDTRALDVDHQLLGPAQPDIRDPVAVRTATAKDSLAIQVDNLALPMRGLGTVRNSTMGLPMPSHKTVLHTMVPNAGRQPSMDTRGHPGTLRL